MTINRLLHSLVHKGFLAGLIREEDTVYVRNRLLAVLDQDSYEEAGGADVEMDIPDLLSAIALEALNLGIIEAGEEEVLTAELMDCFMPKPSEVNVQFRTLYAEDPIRATDYFYNLSRLSNYIQTKRIAQNVHYKVDSLYGELDITINLSKPEKDPAQIARERLLPKHDHRYPVCLLCVENEGYKGRWDHPGRAHHRMIRLGLGGEDWMLQYSPYVYYDEHCIILSEEHRPMEINREGFGRLLDFVEQFPHYFAGSNADLPIVGGSILSHDHYQGGRYEFAMARAGEEVTCPMKSHPSVRAAIVKWPMSVVRLSADEAGPLLDAADDMLQGWRAYSDPSAGVFASTEGEPHNTITPIARKRDGRYELDLVLRNNRRSDEHPFGIFHPHEDVHHIKKENIGLIEVMGLAVLPARLKTELSLVENALHGDVEEAPVHHREWVREIREKRSEEITPDTSSSIVRDELGKKFSRVLEDAGVFKRTEEGMEAFRRFMAQFE
ncbi:UDP-glucose--hexose-1-phosphate uridylyltransferase [Bacillus sp. JRC01]|nr:UDP-glucose--hexose-1-phosphate uridylyltransferase [Bacillus sp. JRC01]